MNEGVDEGGGGIFLRVGKRFIASQREVTYAEGEPALIVERKYNLKNICNESESIEKYLFKYKNYILDLYKKKFCVKKYLN